MSLTPGRFGLSQVIELPFLSPNGEKGSRLVTQLWKDKFSQKEFTDTKLLAIHVHGPGQLHTKTKVTSLKELAGQKLRTVGGGVQWVKALGATPVVLPASAAHEALARGVADGILFPWQAISAYRLGKLVPHHLEIPNGLYTIAFFFTMNKRAYDRLPGKMKAVIDANSGPDTAAFFGRAWDAADVRARKAVAADKSQTITTVDKAVLKELRGRSGAIIDAWKKMAAAKGVDGDAVIKALEQ
jgi:TRAP-type C4-dicarboxylate transport system substrate-binding protein